MSRSGKAGRGALAGAFLPLLLWTPSATAQPSVSSTISSADRERIQHSASAGTLLYALDRAASVSTDSMLRKVDRSRLSGPGGYVVEPGAGERLHVTYYQGEGAAARAFFVADVEQGEVTRDELLQTATPLTAVQAKLAEAREAAARAALAHGYAPCTASPFNSVVIPAADGSIAVYLLTAPTTFDRYPMGGHFRFTIGADGQILSGRAFSAGCLNLELPRMALGERPAGLVTTNRLDPVPTEVYVFASHTLRLPLYVATNDQRFWKVAGHRIELHKND